MWIVLIVIPVTVIFTILFMSPFKLGGDCDRRDYMCFEKCNKVDCKMCIDEPQCDRSLLRIKGGI